MELTFYNRNGQPCCYCQDGEHLYTFGGQPIAYIHEESIYSFPGRHLGWFVNGWIYDSSGHPLLFSEQATGGPGKPGRAGRPGKAGRAGRPGKGGRAGRPGRPGLSASWSSLTAEAFFSGT
ncbi:4-fold beta flower protein [Pseudomonas sp. URMO17WK12:I4]|uniref:4-fold beta flower protein n=1 Tax=Pseudomonas sp. URMO17WK12:I4 TaxID=1283292 RepID=UPI003528E164